MDSRIRYYYEFCCKHYPVNDKLVLLDSFNGRGLSDSSYAVLKEMIAQGLDRTYDIAYVSNDLERDQTFVDENRLPVHLVNPSTRAYARILATAGHLLTNTSFPTFFIRRPEQILVDTWHGTPLKTLGKQMSLGVQSMFYAQHTFMQCSWITFPNDFTRDVMMRDYNLEQLYTGRVAMVGYPRNTILLQGRNDELCSTYHLDGYTNIAYMPTWRGKSTQDINIEDYATQALEYLKVLDMFLADDQRIWVNFHPMVADFVKLDTFEHILPFPSEVSNYDFLSQMDALITDYSSVMFDYALLRRPIILFTYDEDEYLHDRGLYIPLAELPFKKCDTVKELAECLRSGSYRERSAEDESFSEQFIKYDSLENTRVVLDLLLGRDPGDVKVIDYSKNKERTWNVVDALPQKSIADVNGIFLSSDKDRDVILLRKAAFGPVKSRHIVDNYLDGYNFIFITKALPYTPLEGIANHFWPPTQKRLAERERERVFYDLPTAPEARTTYVAGVAGSSYKIEEPLDLPASFHMAGDKLAINWDAQDYVAKRVLLVTRRNIRWTRDLTEQERADGELQLDIAPIAYDTGLRAGNGTRTRVCLLVEDPKTASLLVANLAVGDGSTGRSARYASPVVIDCSEDILAGLRNEEGMVEVPLIDKARERTCVVVPYENDLGRLSLYFTYQRNEGSSFLKPEITSLAMPRQERLEVTIELEDTSLQVEGVELRNRLAGSNTAFPMEFTVAEKGKKLVIKASFDPKNHPYDGLYWDIYLIVTSHDGSVYDLGCTTRTLIRRSLYFRNLQCDLGDGNVFFPFQWKKGRVSFCRREMYPSDTLSTKVKEWAAVMCYILLMPYWKHKRVWLVYEKFCSLAEDNGFAFFRYCMEDAPEEARKHVYYVIKKNEPEFANVERYGKNVIDFMSFRHMLYAIAANIYVGSDAKSHLYQWRPKTSVIKKFIDGKDVFFLQHGVTAMKRVDYLFGKRGNSPMTYFLTTSRKEQDIVIANFGYDDVHSPVLGFSRWDVLENHADASRPTILLMPTWRQWLEDVGEEAFTSSDYYNAYAGLIQDERLHKLLEQANATLKFFIHPKLSNELRHFSASSDHVELIEMGSAPLNQIIMECSALITDYSSVAWDVLYMDKPTIFYQFDQDRYNSEVGSYINLNTELPGPICKDLDQLIDAFDVLVQNGFTITDEDAIKLKGWYESKDSRNRERTYRYLLSQEY